MAAPATPAPPMTSIPATARLPKVFIRWHFLSTALYRLIRLPMAPLVSCMQLSSILGFIIRMSAWDGGEKVDFFAIASLRTDSQ